MLNKLRTTAAVIFASAAAGYLPGTAWAQGASFFTCDPSVDICDVDPGRLPGGGGFGPGGNNGGDGFFICDPNVQNCNDGFGSGGGFDDDFDDFNGGGFDDFDSGFDTGGDFGGGSFVTIERFDLSGQGCPARGSTRVFLDSSSNNNTNRVRVQFGAGNNQSNNRFFQITGGGTGSRTCTARVRLIADSDVFVGGDGSFTVTPDDNFTQPLEEFQLRRAVSGVRFVNRNGNGQMIVRTQFRVDDATGRVRQVRLPNSSQTQTNDFVFAQNLRVQPRGSAIELLANLQLEFRNVTDAIVRLEDLSMEFSTLR